MVFQDPYSSLNNRRTVGQILSDPLIIFGLERDRSRRGLLVRSFLDLVGLPERAFDRYPHQFSGGERQRIAVARALLSRPALLLCDEPTSSLDVSIQAQVLNLLRDLQREFDLSLLFISHDLSVIRQMADHIAVMKNGRIVETADNEQFFAGPDAPYSRELLRLTPTLDGALSALGG
jgi:peptide/nickel transport system ATP-binding protein